MDIQEILTLKKDLRFKNGKFRILMMSDLHGGIGMSAQLPVAIRAMVEHCKPDLVLIGGDTSGCGPVHVETQEQLKEVLEILTAPMEENNIPWAHVFGNHDDNFGLSNEEQEPVYESFPCCVSKWGPKDVYGVANYVLPVKASDGDEVIFNVFGLDSHNNIKTLGNYHSWEKDPEVVLDQHFCYGRGYDTVRFEQIMWYWNTSKAMQEHFGKKIPAFMFCHIPLSEHTLVVQNMSACDYNGCMREDVGCGELNSGLFAACVERGDVKAICCGHDHVNNFVGEYCGIQLCCDGGLDYDCYQDDDLRSVRIFDINESDPSKIETYPVFLREVMGRAGDKVQK